MTSARRHRSSRQWPRGARRNTCPATKGRSVFSARGRTYLPRVLSAVVVALLATGTFAVEPASPPALQDLSLSGCEHSVGNRPLVVRFKFVDKGRDWSVWRQGVHHNYHRLLFSQLDTDRDEFLNQQEARGIPTLAVFPAAGEPGSAFLAFNFRILDQNQDRAASLDEVNQYLAEFDTPPLALSVPRSDLARDILFSALDTDQDGTLTRAEGSQAASVMQKYDVDENRVLDADELGEHAGKIAPPEFHAAASSDQHMPLEFALRDAAPRADFELLVEPAPGPVGGPKLAGSRLRGLLSREAETAGLTCTFETSTDTVLTVANRRIVFRLRWTTIGAEVALQRQLQHVLAEALDAAPGSLATSEELLPVLKSLCLVADRDRSGQLEPAEIDVLRDRLIPGRAVLEATCVELQCFAHQTGLMPLIDLNRDGRLGARELRALPDRLAAIAGERGEITRQELADVSLVIIGPGAWMSSDGATPLDDKPTWFMAADWNEDGDVDRQEFDDKPEVFAELDVNQDGWIDGEEALLGESEVD